MASDNHSIPSSKMSFEGFFVGAFWQFFVVPFCWVVWESKKTAKRNSSIFHWSKYKFIKNIQTNNPNQQASSSWAHGKNVDQTTKWNLESWYFHCASQDSFHLPVDGQNFDQLLETHETSWNSYTPRSFKTSHPENGTGPHKESTLLIILFPGARKNFRNTNLQIV